MSLSPEQEAYEKGWIDSAISSAILIVIREEEIAKLKIKLKTFVEMQKISVEIGRKIDDMYKEYK